MSLRPVRASDHDVLISVLQPVFAAGDTYAFDTDMTRDGTLAKWRDGHDVFVAETTDGDSPQILGSYYICANQSGGGSHVCNCGFVTAPAARGKGVARLMLEHALQTARDQGFRAMQFNFVVSTNTRAISIWQDYGFDVVGRLPGAFRHPSEGYVDALVMYRDLTKP
ncbi:GNAT family N-acetyltransferase [Roseibium algae]|uniref:GNAT family N-acetyltransferase n=1 Tax=Roseibium algae TaxID=3123038 RepID=UPI003BF5B794